MSSVIFVVLIGVMGGPVEGDAAESVYSTWSIAHGRLACVYPTGTYHPNDLANPFALTAPLYPLLTGLFSAILRIGHKVPFPSTRALGPSCSHAFAAMFHWSVNAGVILPTIRLSYLVWPLLLAGAVLLVRAAGRGRSRWEVFAVLLLSVTTPIWMCIVDFFHPQDLLAMALILGSIALVLKRSWIAAGALMGLALASQQYSLLAAVVLITILPSKPRIRYALSALVMVAIVDVPFIVATSGRAMKTVILGSSRVGSNVRPHGVTIVWELNLHGVVSFVVTRLLPILLAIAVAWWASRRLGSDVLTPVPMLSLVAAAFVARLVFEVNLFGYYFMAVAVTLVLLDVASQKVRGEVVAWLGLVTLAFNPVPFGFFSNITAADIQLFYVVQISLWAICVISMAKDAFFHRFRLYKAVWLVLVSLTCESKLFGMTTHVIYLRQWCWQIILVSTASYLVFIPLMDAVKARKTGVGVVAAVDNAGT